MINYNSFAKRAFYTQTGVFSFLIDLMVNNVTGILDFGFSGSGLLPFSMRNGKILDNAGNFVGVYESGVLHRISGNVSPTTLDYYIDNDPIAFGIQRQAGSLSYFYVNPKNCEVGFELEIRGEIPNYTITYPTGFLTGTANFPITLNNSSLPFKIFSGEYGGDSSVGSLSGLTTGTIGTGTGFYIRQSGISGKVTFPINLYTNFGFQQIIINSSGH